MLAMLRAWLLIEAVRYLLQVSVEQLAARSNLKDNTFFQK
jgi:hypothetical protein